MPRKLGGNTGHNGSDRGPLRRVVNMADNPAIKSVHLELLECGHTQFPKSDLFGHTNASRRRCRKCKRGKPPDELTASTDS